jgi:hypothetical protein
MYVYADYRDYVFTEEGQRTFLSIRDKAGALTKQAGAATMEKIIGWQTGLNWHHMACVDRLVEIGDLLEIPNTVTKAGQFRLFMWGHQQ